MQNVAVIGAGAAGYFTALTIAEADPSAKVTIYESGRKTLSKVKISGGGRCNVTHHCFDPKELATRYPRGSKELRAAFHRWQPQDTIDWFAGKGVRLKVEEDGRMFPTTDQSQTIIDCFEKTARDLGITVLKGVGLKDLTPNSSPLTPHSFTLHLSDDTEVNADKVAITAGSLKASSLATGLARLGHTIDPLVPSLFAFNISDKRTYDLSGISVPLAEARTVRKGSAQEGPLLITHRGLSGPAILRLSAWEARELHKENYHFDIFVNWLGKTTEAQVREKFAILRTRSGKAAVRQKVFEDLPKRLWERLLSAADITEDTTWAQLAKKKEQALIHELVNGRYSVTGKTTNKEKVNSSLVRSNGLPKVVPAEFVHAGGISRKEIDWRRMESRIVPGLHFAGECIDIDGITGGFNFQAAWTTAHIAGEAIAQ